MGHRIYDTRTLGLDPRALAALPRRRVLVVDDDPDTVETEALLLEMLGQVVRKAHDGATALRVAITFRPDIVFLDLEMPRSNGLEVARQLRQLSGMQDARIIAYTGTAPEKFRPVAFSSGFDEFVLKPIALTRVISILQYEPEESRLFGRASPAA